MRLTPGQLLDAEIKRRGLKYAAFARMVPVTPATVWNWINDRGFGKPQREAAARALGLPPNHFDHPTLAEQREEERLTAFHEFRSLPVAHDIIEEEIRGLLSIFWPPYLRVEAVHFLGVFLLWRRLMSPTEIEQSLPSMRQGVDEFLRRQKTEITPKASPKRVTKSGKGRRRPRSPHK